MNYKPSLIQGRFYGVPGDTEKAWFWEDEHNKRKLTYFGGYSTLFHADNRGEILWLPLVLKKSGTRIQIPILPFSELLYISVKGREIPKSHSY